MTVVEYRVSQLADRVGLSASTLRHYEQQGLLPADRSPSGYRLYDQQAVERLGFIAAAKHLGLPLAQIRDLLAVWESGPCAQVQNRLRPLLQDGVETATARVEELVAFVGRLQAALAQLDEPAKLGRCDPSCDFLTGSSTSTFRGATRAPMPDLMTWDTRRTVAGRLAPSGPTSGVSATAVACAAAPQRKADQLRDWSDLITQADEVTRFEGGFRVRLPISRVATAAQVAAAEQACCPFFDMRLALAGPVFDLEVRAPADASAMLDELLGQAA